MDQKASMSSKSGRTRRRSAISHCSSPMVVGTVSMETKSRFLGTSQTDSCKGELHILQSDEIGVDPRSTRKKVQTFRLQRKYRKI